MKNIPPEKKEQLKKGLIESGIEFSTLELL